MHFIDGSIEDMANKFPSAFYPKDKITSDFDNFDDFPYFNTVDFEEPVEETNLKKDSNINLSESEKNKLPKIQFRLDNLRIPATPGRPKASRAPLKARLPPAHGLQITPLSTIPSFLQNLNCLVLINVKQITLFEARLIAARSVTDESQRAEIELHIQLPPMIADTPDKLSVPGQESLAHAATPLLLIVKTLHHNKITERALIGI
jgi:hypothetical protein